MAAGLVAGSQPFDSVGGRHWAFSGGARCRRYSHILNFPICAIVITSYHHIWGAIESGTHLGGQMGEHANTNQGERPQP